MATEKKTISLDGLVKIVADDESSGPGDIVHLVIDIAESGLCDPTRPFLFTNDITGVTCERCRRIWIGGL